MKDILDIKIDGIGIAEIPEYMQQEMTDEQFEEFKKQDNTEDSIEDVVKFLKKLKVKNDK